jgi:hypothetical protein
LRLFVYKLEKISWEGPAQQPLTNCHDQVKELEIVFPEKKHLNEVFGVDPLDGRDDKELEIKYLKHGRVEVLAPLSPLRSKVPRPLEIVFETTSLMMFR